MTDGIIDPDDMVKRWGGTDRPAAAQEEVRQQQTAHFGNLPQTSRLCTMDSQRTKGRISSTKSPQEVEHAYPARSDYIAAESI